MENRIQALVEQLREKRAERRQILLNFKFNLYLLQRNIDKFNVEFSSTKSEFDKLVNTNSDTANVFQLNNDFQSTGT